MLLVSEIELGLNLNSQDGNQQKKVEHHPTARMLVWLAK
jgi:hypothetical protein